MYERLPPDIAARMAAARARGIAEGRQDPVSGAILRSAEAVAYRAEVRADKAAGEVNRPALEAKGRDLRKRGLL